MTYPLPGVFVDGSVTVPVSANNLNDYTTAITGLDTRAPIRGSFANPNGNVTGSPGNTYSSTAGGTGTTFWIKESGTGTTSGWVAVSSGGGGGVPTSRLITSGTGLSGGGDLTADRTLIVVADTTTQRIEVAKNGTQVGVNARKRINLIEGANVTITAADNSGGNQLDVTINAATTGGSGIPVSTVTTKGDLIVRDSSAPNRLALSATAGQVLTVDPTNATLGVNWSSPAVSSVAGRAGAVVLTNADVGLGSVANSVAIPKSTVTTPGDLIVYNAAAFGPARLPVGTTNGMVLAVDSTSNNGMSWTTPAAGGSGIPASTITARGDLIVGGTSATPVRLPVGADGYRIKALGAAPGGSGMFWVPPINETISDGSATVYTPRAVLRFLGSGVTVADNSAGSPPSTDVTIAGSSGTPALITTPGDLIVGNASGAASRLASTLTDGQVLTLNSSAGSGLNWADSPTYYGAIQTQGSVVTKQTTLNFTGPNVSAKNNASQSRTDVTVAEFGPVPADHGLSGWTFPTYACGSTQAMTSGLVYLAKIKVPFALNVTKILWHVATSAVGATTAQNEVGIYSNTGTKQTSVSATTDSGSANQTLITSTITSITANPPFIWVGFVFNAATTPVGLGRSNSAFINVFNAGLTASSYDFATNVSSQTILPTSLTLTSNVAGPGIWAAVA